MSETGSKFGMLRNLQQATTDSQNEAVKQQNSKEEKQKSAKNLKPQSTIQVKQPSQETSPEVELKHYSSYMPITLYAQLQIYVAKRKAARGNTGDKVSLQSVISEAIQQYLDQNDR